MSFKDIPNIEKYDFYIGVAFRAGTKAADDTRGGTVGTRLDKSKKIEMARVLAIKKSVEHSLKTIEQKYPSLDDLTEFYKEMIKVTLDYVEIKKSLGSVKWCIEKLNELFEMYYDKLKKCKDLDYINTTRREFMGRVSSVLKQIRHHLEYLEETRKTVLGFPVIKQKYITVAIAGFPNVGKSTLLKRLTPAKPEIKSYAFTTKSLNCGYVENFQFIDTPGTLNREEKMNQIEAYAYLAMKYCADIIIYVYDVTEPYSLDEQKKLLLRVKKFGKPILLYVSKSDVVDEKLINDFCKGKEIMRKSEDVIPALKKVEVL